MNRKQRYENALKIAIEKGNTLFQAAIKRELKHMEGSPELAAEEATPYEIDD